MNVVIPMAGDGQRFKNSKWKTLKPFIKWNGRTMIEYVMENLNYKKSARFILILRKEHFLEYQEELELLKRKYHLSCITIENKTEGPLCTILFARDLINNDEPLLIANSDQVADCSVDEFIDDCFARNLDGSLLTFYETEKSPRWSFVKTDEKGFVTEVKAKVPFSHEGVVGWYFYTKGSDFVDAAIDLIICNDRANNEFFQCPTYNYAIRRHKRFGTFMIEEGQMHGTGTPEDLQKYLDTLDAYEN